MAHGTGQFQGLGRGWRKQVEYVVCNRCYGSGGGPGEELRCDHCNGQGMVYELKPDAAKQQRIDARADHIKNSINLAVFKKSMNYWSLQDAIYIRLLKATKGPTRIFSVSQFEHVAAHMVPVQKEELLMDFIDTADFFVNSQ